MHRRRFLVLAGSAAGLAGCSSGGDTPAVTPTDTDFGTPTATNTETRRTTDTAMKTPTGADTATETTTDPDTETATETRTTADAETDPASQTATRTSEGGITFDEDGRSLANGYEVDTTVTNNNDHDVTVALDVRLLDENGDAVADQYKEQVVTANSTWDETFTFDQSGEGHEVEFTVSE